MARWGGQSTFTTFGSAIDYLNAPQSSSHFLRNLARYTTYLGQLYAKIRVVTVYEVAGDTISAIDSTVAKAF